MNAKTTPATPRQADSILTRVLHFIEGLSTVQFLFILFLFLVYVVGNFQSLSDGSMYLILNILSVMGLSAALTNFLCIIAIIVWSIRHRALIVGRMIFSLITLILGLFVGLIVAVLNGFIQTPL